MSVTSDLVDPSGKFLPKGEYPRNVAQSPQKFFGPRSLSHAQLNRKGSLVPIFGLWEKNTVEKDLNPKCLKYSNLHYYYQFTNQCFENFWSLFFLNMFLWKDLDDHYLLCQRPGGLRGTVQRFERHPLNLIIWRQYFILQDEILNGQFNFYQTDKKIQKANFAERQAFSDMIGRIQKYNPSGSAWHIYSSNFKNNF